MQEGGHLLNTLLTAYIQLLTQIEQVVVSKPICHHALRVEFTSIRVWELLQSIQMVMVVVGCFGGLGFFVSISSLLAQYL